MNSNVSEDTSGISKSKDKRKNNLTILLAEDNKIDQKILTAFLAETDYGDSKIITSETIRHTKRLVQRIHVDIVMLDLFLSDSHGMETISALRGLISNIPIIVLSGMSDKNYAAKAINYGAQDFIVKGEYTASSLEKSIKYAMERQNLIKERKKAETEFQIQIEQERQRIAMDIHDGLGQMLIATKYRLSNIDLNNTEELNKEVDVVEEMITKAIEEARKISENITPRVMNEYGLKAAIEQMCDQISNNSEYTIHVKIDDDIPTFDMNLLTNLYRITQEALNNVVKYAKGRNTYVELSYISNTLTLEIRDDGIGFDLENYNPGNGLKNIQKRADFINGTFNMHSELGVGTTVSVEVPYMEPKKF